MIKIKIIKDIEEGRWKKILNYHQVMKDNGIIIVNDLKKADVLLYTIDSRVNFTNLPQNQKKLLMNSKIPVIMVERLDSAVTWFREFDQIPNLKAVFKNRICRPASINNEVLYYGRYHYKLIYDKCKKLGYRSKSENQTDLSKHWKEQKLKPISEENLKKIKSVIWDFHSSYWSKRSNPYRQRMVNINFDAPKKYDVFCVVRDKAGIQGFSRSRAKRIVASMKNIKSLTNPLSSGDYKDKFVKSKIAVTSWGHGEWIHADGYSFISGVIIIKPDTSWVDMYPDLYQNDKTYIACKPDYSDLEEKINMVLSNYDSYKEMRIKNREMIMNVSEQDLTKRFCDEIKEAITDPIS